ncbi:MAG: hypothetical protein U1A27_13390 [Phycisphaerae bacterium]
MTKLFARAALTLGFAGVLFGTAWWARGEHDRQQRIAELEAEKAELLRVVDRLKHDRRVARLYVADQRRDARGQVVETVIDFVGAAADGRERPTRTVRIRGDVCYVDALVIRFLDSYVERGDKLRGHTLHLFRRIFGEGQAPADGAPLDEPGAIPAEYRVDDEASRFEKRLWQRFWEYAVNPQMATEVGVRVAQGEAAYQRLSTGQLWQIATRANGGLEMTLLPVDPLLAKRLASSQPGKVN